MASVTMTVNGKSVTADVDPRTLLAQFVREHLRLTGTHVGLRYQASAALASCMSTARP